MKEGRVGMGYGYAIKHHSHDRHDRTWSQEGGWSEWQYWELGPLIQLMRSEFWRLKIQNVILGKGWSLLLAVDIRLVVLFFVLCRIYQPDSAITN